MAFLTTMVVVIMMWNVNIISDAVNQLVIVFIFTVVMTTMMALIMMTEMGGGYDDIRGGGESVGAVI